MQNFDASNTTIISQNQLPKSRGYFVDRYSPSSMVGQQRGDSSESGSVLRNGEQKGPKKVGTKQSSTQSLVSTDESVRQLMKRF